MRSEVFISLAIVITFVAGVCVGKQYADERIAEAKSDYAAQIAQQEKDYAERLSSEFDAYIREADVANDRARTLDSTVLKLRKQLASAEARAKGSVSTDSTTTAGCIKLLSEGAALLGEGANLLERNAVKHDSLASVVSK